MSRSNSLHLTEIQLLGFVVLRGVSATNLACGTCKTQALYFRGGDEITGRVISNRGIRWVKKEIVKVRVRENYLSSPPLFGRGSDDQRRADLKFASAARFR